MPKRSKALQNRLNRELFGPGPKTPRYRKRVIRPAPPTPKHEPGDCGFCGNRCDTLVDWTCSFCGVTYHAKPYTATV